MAFIQDGPPYFPNTRFASHLGKTFCKTEALSYPNHMDFPRDTNPIELLHAIEDGDPGLKRSHLGNALSFLKSHLPENSWVGLYVDDGFRLILDAFQGTMACERIAYGKGVVGTCFQKGETIHVSDVSTFPGYICCDAAAKSEICIPLKRHGHIIAILDIDRPDIHDFSSEVEFYEEVGAILTQWL